MIHSTSAFGELMISAVPGRPDNCFELLVQSVTDYAIYMLDPTGVIVSWNAGARRFKGYEADEIIGQHFSRFYTAEDQASGVPALALYTAEHDGRFEAEGWRVRKGDTRFWASVVIDPIRDPSGQLLGFAKITRDMTEQRSAREALRHSEERFRLLVDSVTDYAIYMLDPVGTVTSWNRGAERCKGYSADEIVGQNFSRFYSEEDRIAGLPSRALHTAEQEGRFEAEGWRIRKDGTRFWANVVIDPIRDPLGQLHGFAKVTRDLTERREAQRALDEARDAIVQTQKMDAIGKLTGGVAHDFNNLLAVIVGSLDLARQRMASGADISRYLDNAMAAAERGATLTQRMLAFARKQELKLQCVDCIALVRDMADLLQTTLGSGITIETRFPLAMVPAHADPTQLELALLNLAVNARDAMLAKNPNGGGTLTIETLSVAAHEVRAMDEDVLPVGDYTALRVSDTGSGIPADVLAHIWEPFFTTKEVGKGTGLGLSTVYGIIKQSGGFIFAESEPGKGAVFTIYLPVHNAPEPTAQLPTAKAVQGDLWGSGTILLVEDEAMVRAVAERALARQGYTVLTAENGEAALELLEKSEKPDLLISDVVMPTMDGPTMVRHARKKYPDLKIIFMSGYAEEQLRKSIDLDNVAFLPKPFSVQQLAELARSVMTAK